MKQARFECSKELRKVLKGQEELVLEVIFTFCLLKILTKNVAFTSKY